MLDLRTWSALPHVGGVVPLFEHCLRCSLHGCSVSQPVSRRLHLSTLARAGSLSTCAAVEQPDSVPEPRHCRSLESWQVCAWCRWWTLPGFPAQSARERRTATCASLSTKPAAGTGSCVKPQRRGRGVDSRDLDPALGNLPRPCASL